MRKKRLPQEALKLIACLSMFLDHFGAAIVPNLAIPHVVTVYFTCRLIGRIAFPIYCFLLVEGMRHTKNAQKYLLRMATGILLAEIPFDLIFSGGFTWAYQSVMVTLTLGVLMLSCMGKTEKKGLKLLIILPFAIVAEMVQCDYGGWGMVLIAVFALFDGLPLQLLGMFLVSALMPSATFSVLGVPVSVELAAVFAALPIACYSGEKRTQSKAVQWGFYLFYPLHLLVLWIFLGFLR